MIERRAAEKEITGSAGVAVVVPFTNVSCLFQQTEPASHIRGRRAERQRPNVLKIEVSEAVELAKKNYVARLEAHGYQ